MKTEGLFIKTSGKSGDELGKAESLNMLTRKVGGEVCVDVECGPNKAVLYVSKLFGGSKKLCIFFDDEWITPNEFQNVSGRRSAKDWKRSIRHNGISLKTFMLSGVLGMPEDGSNLSNGGSNLGNPCMKATGKVQHKRKLKKKLKRKSRHAVKPIRARSVTPELVTPDLVTHESVARESVTPDPVTCEPADDILGSDSDTQMAIDQGVDDSVKARASSDDVPDVEEVTKDDSDIDEKKVEIDLNVEDDHTQGKKLVESKKEESTSETISRHSDDETDRVQNTSIAVQPTSPINKINRPPIEHGGLDTKMATVMDPYQVTVTPPPTPPSEDRKEHLDTGVTDAHTISSRDTNSSKGVVLTGKGTIEYKPYLNSREHAKVPVDTKRYLSRDTHSFQNGQGSRSPFNNSVDYTKGGNVGISLSRDNTVTSLIATSLPSFHVDQKIPSENRITRSPLAMREPARDTKHCNKDQSKVMRSHSPAAVPYPSITSANHPLTPYGLVKHGHTGISPQAYHHPSSQTGMAAQAIRLSSSQTGPVSQAPRHSLSQTVTSASAPRQTSGQVGHSRVSHHPSSHTGSTRATHLPSSQPGSAQPGSQVQSAAQALRFPKGISYNPFKCNTTPCSSERTLFANHYGDPASITSPGRIHNLSVSCSPRSSTGCSPRSSAGSSSGSSVGGSPGLCTDITHPAQKRQRDELNEDKPLDLSMKKTKVRDHDDVTSAKSRDRGHVTYSSFETRDKTMKSQHADLFRFAPPIPTSKNTNGAVYPFINPLHTLNPMSPLSALQFEHRMGQPGPCLCSLCVNPVSLYVPYVWDWRHVVEHKV